jgi:hypothetical protein
MEKLSVFSKLWVCRKQLATGNGKRSVREFVKEFVRDCLRQFVRGFVI